MSVLTASIKRHSRAPGAVPLALVAALALVGAVAGMLGGGAFWSEPAPVAKPSPAVLAAGGLRVQPPEGWARSAPVALAGFSHALWLRDDAAKIDAAIALAPAVSPTLLPAGLRPVGAPRLQQLGAHTAWRYRTETSTGVPAIFFVAPTTNGIATVGCVGAVAGTPERACRALASAVALTDAQRLELGQNAAFLSALPAVISKLNTARVGGASRAHRGDRPHGAGERSRPTSLARTAPPPPRSRRSPTVRTSRAPRSTPWATASAYSAARRRGAKPQLRSLRAGGRHGRRRRASCWRRRRRRRALRAGAATPAACPRRSREPPVATPASTPAAPGGHPREHARRAHGDKHPREHARRPQGDKHPRDQARAEARYPQSETAPRRARRPRRPLQTRSRHPPSPAAAGACCSSSGSSCSS